MLVGVGLGVVATAIFHLTVREETVNKEQLTSAPDHVSQDNYLFVKYFFASGGSSLSASSFYSIHSDPACPQSFPTVRDYFWMHIQYSHQTSSGENVPARHISLPPSQKIKQ